MADTPKIWTRRNLNGDTIMPEEDEAQGDETEETTDDESDSSTIEVTSQEMSESQESHSITREEIAHLKSDCKSAGIDAVPALEMLENSLFGQERRLARNKKPRAKTADEADKAECVKRIDQARKITATNIVTNERPESGKDASRSKKTPAVRIRKN